VAVSATKWLIAASAGEVGDEAQEWFLIAVR
jgi:hypothetical protein